MAREDPHFRLRFPTDLREKVEASARANKRSMTAEIIHRLEGTFPASDAKFIEGRRPTKAEIDAALKVLEHLKYYAHEVLIDEDIMRPTKPKAEE